MQGVSHVRPHNGSPGARVERAQGAFWWRRGAAINMAGCLVEPGRGVGYGRATLAARRVPLRAVLAPARRIS